MIKVDAFILQLEEVNISKYNDKPITLDIWGRRGRDHMVVGFTTTCAISA
jgi:hypothetical protein